MGKYLFMCCENAHYMPNLYSYLKESVVKKYPNFGLSKMGSGRR